MSWFANRTSGRFGEHFGRSRCGRKPTKVQQQGAHTVRAYYGTLETSFIRYEQVPARPEDVKVGGTKISLADLEILAAMKAAAVHDRGAKRDFIDIHAICAEPGWSVPGFIHHAARVLPLEPEQVARSLVYFLDAEKDPMPKARKASWEEVKADLVKGVRRWQWARDQDIER